jgi:hypothetical protein
MQDLQGRDFNRNRAIGSEPFRHLVLAQFESDLTEAERIAVSTLRTIPDTHGGKVYRVVLLVVGISSIVGIADHARALFWRVLSGPPSHGGMGVAQRLIILAGWGIMCWCAVRAFRSNALPPTWAVVAVPVLIWAYLLWPG